MDLSSIYTEIIAQYSRSQENRRHQAAPQIVLRGRNPSCGDDITLEMSLAGGMVKDVSFIGSGCAISQASAALMAELVKGRSIQEAGELADIFLGMIKREEPDGKNLSRLGEAACLQSVANLPARVKCVGLAWHTLQEALQKKA